MALKTYIGDGAGTGLEAHVVQKECGINAQVVATVDLNNFETFHSPFVSENFGTAMNIEYAYGDTPEKVYNADDTLWTQNNISGTVAVDSSVRFYDGAESLYWNSADLNSVIEFAKGSTFDLSNYIDFTMWINIDRKYDVGDSIEIYGWDGSIVGNAVLLENYCNINNDDVWQKVVIPLADMGLTNQSITALRFRISAIDGKPNIWYDALQFEEKDSESGAFVVRPSKEYNVFISEIRLFMVDVLDTTLSNNSMANLSHDKLLNVNSLSSGISISLYSGDTLMMNSIFKNLGDFLSFPNCSISDVGSDGDGKTFIAIDIKVYEPFLLKSMTQDSLRISIFDDLSGLERFNAFAGGKRLYIGCKK